MSRALQTGSPKSFTPYSAQSQVREISVHRNLKLIVRERTPLCAVVGLKAHDRIRLDGTAMIEKDVLDEAAPAWTRLNPKQAESPFGAAICHPDIANASGKLRADAKEGMR